MNSTILLCALFLASAPWKASSEPVSSGMRGLDSPRASLRREMGPSPTSPGTERVRTCRVYTSFAVLWTSDPGLIGAPDLEVRQLKSEAAPLDACSDGFTGRRTIVLEFSDAEPVGTVDRYLVLVYPDGAGAMTSLQVMDMPSGRMVRDVAFNWEKGVDFSRSAASVVATYWRSLGSLPCVPSPKSGACWREIVGAQRSLSLAGVPPPDCDPALKAWRWKTPPGPAELQIAVKVRDVIDSSGTQVLPVAPSCNFAD